MRAGAGGRRGAARETPRLNPLKRQPKLPRSPLALALWALGLLFVGSILWSMWVDTLRPLLRAGDTSGVAMHLIGLPLMLVGTGAVVWGGARFVRDTFRAGADPEMRAGVAAVWEGTAEEARAARWQNFRMLLGAWKRGPS